MTPISPSTLSMGPRRVLAASVALALVATMASPLPAAAAFTKSVQDINPGADGSSADQFIKPIRLSYAGDIDLSLNPRNLDNSEKPFRINNPGHFTGYSETHGLLTFRNSANEPRRWRSGQVPSHRHWTERRCAPEPQTLRFPTPIVL